MNAVAKECIDAGVMEKNFGQDTVKVHVTVMNSKWRAEEREHRRGRRSENAFDIRGILKVHKSGCASILVCAVLVLVVVVF